MKLTIKRTRWLLITLCAIVVLMATMSAGAAASDKVLTSDQDNEVLINLGADADTVTFLGEDAASDELVVNDEDGSLILTADYLDGVARVGVHSDDGTDIYTLTGTGPVVGSLVDDGVDPDIYDIDFCGTDSEGLTIDDDGGSNTIDVNLDSTCSPGSS